MVGQNKERYVYFKPFASNDIMLSYKFEHNLTDGRIFIGTHELVLRKVLVVLLTCSTYLLYYNLGHIISGLFTISA